MKSQRAAFYRAYNKKMNATSRTIHTELKYNFDRMVPRKLKGFSEINCKIQQNSTIVIDHKNIWKRWNSHKTGN